MLITLALIVILIGLSYLFLISNFNFWTKRGITSPKLKPFYGNYPKALNGQQHLIFDLDNIYRAYKDKEDFVGIYSIRTPQLLILNPKLCQQIFTQHFKYFQANEISIVIDKCSDVLIANGPFSLTGDEWKEARSLMEDGLKTELFKSNFYAVREACKKMSLRIEDHVQKSSKEGITVQDLCFYFTAEVVTQWAFGFIFHGQPSTQLVFNAIFKAFHRRWDVSLNFIVFNLLPSMRKFYKIRLLPQRIAVLFEKLMKTAIELRKTQSEYQNCKDFLNHLLNIQKRKNLSTLEMATHSVNFITHGFLAIYTTLSHCLYLLAKYPESQERLHLEIQQHVKKNKSMDFEKVVELPFLEACVYETIRMLPPVFYSLKICTESILLPNKSNRSLKLEKGEIVLLPMYSIMNDENFYTKPNEFRPERFIGPNGCNIDDFYRKGVYYGFGAGPRECVGKKFALTQIKAALLEICSKFKISLNPKTKDNNEIDPHFFSIRLKNKIWLDFEAIKPTVSND